MKQTAFAVLFALALTFSLGAQPAWARQCPKLYKQAQELIAQQESAPSNPEAFEEAKKLAEKGLKLHEEGNHSSSVETLRKALKLLKGS